MKDEKTIYPFDNEKELHDLDNQLRHTKNSINCQTEKENYVLAAAIGECIVVTIKLGQETSCPKRFDKSRQGYKDAINYINSTCLSSGQGSHFFLQEVRA